MNRNFYLIVTLMLVNQIYAQKFRSEIDSIVKIEISNLKKSGITKIGFINLTCTNYGIYSTVFLFWNKGDVTYCQKFKNSKTKENSLNIYKPIKIKDTLFFSFFKLNKNKIEEGEVLPFQYQKDSLNIKKGISSRIVSMHTCIEYFEIEIEHKIYNYKYDYFDTEEFDKEKIDNSKLTKEEIEKWKKKGWEIDTTYENYPNRNINYDYNKDLIILNWSKKLKKMVELLEEEKKFIIQKQNRR